MDKKEKDNFERFLRLLETENLDWWVDLTVPETKTEREADKYFDNWIGVMAELNGTSMFYWAQIAEKNKDGSMTLHVLIGGRHTRDRWGWMEGWRKDMTENGTAMTRRLRPTKQLRGLIEYLVTKIGCGVRVGGNWGSDVLVKGCHYGTEPVEVGVKKKGKTNTAGSTKKLKAAK